MDVLTNLAAVREELRGADLSRSVIMSKPNFLTLPHGVAASCQGFADILGNDGYLDPDAKERGQPIIDVTADQLRDPPAQTVAHSA